MAQLGAGCGGQLDPRNTSRPQSLGRGAERRARGNHVVDDKDSEVTARPPSAKCRTNKALGA